MSVFAYFSTGKFNASAWLRDALKRDADAARIDPARVLATLAAGDPDIRPGVPPDPGQSVSQDLYDPVLRAHCRIPFDDPAGRPVRKRLRLPGELRGGVDGIAP
jgi:hypothetical protein